MSRMRKAEDVLGENEEPIPEMMNKWGFSTNGPTEGAMKPASAGRRSASSTHSSSSTPKKITDTDELCDIFSLTNTKDDGHKQVSVSYGRRSVL